MEGYKRSDIENAVLQYASQNEDKIVALFDPCSTFTLARLKSLVKNLRKCSPLTVTTSMGTYSRIQNVGDNSIIPGPIYFDEQSEVNIICAHDMLTDKAKFQVKAFADGTYDITHKSSGHVFKVRWFKKVLVVDVTVCADN